MVHLAACGVAVQAILPGPAGQRILGPGPDIHGLINMYKYYVKTAP